MKIGKYIVKGTLGQGGMGMVYRALDPVIDREVAVKVIQERALSPAVKARFYKEAQSAGRLSHEHIMTLYDVGEEEGAPYLVMELLSGTDLRHLLQEETPLPLAEKLSIALQICRGLHYAHTRRVIHRDIKPENIRVLEDGRVKIMDFGLARIESDPLTHTCMGTPRYMSPEQVRGEPVDHRTDIFSFGVLFYELLSGTNPFSGERVTSIIYKILNKDPEPVPVEDGILVKDLQRIVSRCIEKEADRRYEDFGAVIGELKQVTARLETGQTLTQVVSPAAAQKPAGRRGSRRPVQRVIAGLLIAAVVAGGYLGYQAVRGGGGQAGAPVTASVPAEEPPPAAADLQKEVLKATPETETPADGEPVSEPADDASADNESTDRASPEGTPPRETQNEPAQQADRQADDDAAAEEEPAEEEQPAAEADRRAEAMRAAKASVAPALRQHDRYRQALGLERQGARRYEAGAFAEAAGHYEDAEAGYREVAAMPTPEEEVERALQTLAAQFKESLEAEDARGLRAVSAFYAEETWSQFFGVAQDITATVETGAVRVSGNTATASVSARLQYLNNRNERQESRLNYIWTLTKTQDGAWAVSGVENR